MKTECPFCNQHYEVDDEYLDQVVECPQCKEEFSVQPLEEDKTIISQTDSLKEIKNNITQKASASIFKNKPIKKNNFLKLKVAGFILIIVFSIFGIYYYNYNKNENLNSWSVDKNKKIMEEALLDLAKYPGSSSVTFRYYNAFPQADFIVADGYIDMANGFGVKSRYEFSFHVEKYTTVNRFFFSCFGGQKIISSKRDLGQICLKDLQGEFIFIQSEEKWKY